MFNFSLLLVIVAALSLIDKAYCKDSHLNFKLSVIRGGAKPNKQAYSTKSKKSKTKQYEEDDDDEDDEEDDDRSISKKKHTNIKSSSKSNSMKSKKSSSGSSSSNSGKNKQRLDLVPAKRGKSNKKTSGFQLPTIPNLNFREKLDDLAKSSQSVYKDVYRRAKVMRSSPFEGMLLKATWPGNEPIAPELLNEIIRHSIPAFKYGSSSNAEDDPYHMTLHKLWTKMCEKDWRVVVKSTFILHCISRDSSADTCEKFASAIKSMSKHRNPKKPNHKYFNIRMMTELDAISQTYQSFISAYATHVLYRAKNFIGKFDDLKQLPEDAKLKLVVSKLQKAKQCIINGLECTVTRKDHAKPVIGQAVKSVALDLRELWKIYSSKIPLLLSYETAQSSGTTVTASATPNATPTVDSNDESSNSSSSSTGATTSTTTSKPTSGTTTQTSSMVSSGNNPALVAEITELLTFYKETEDKIQSYLQSSAKTFSKLKMKIPIDLDSDEVDMDQVNVKVTQLLNSISGGASAIGKKKNSSSNSSSSKRQSAKKVSKSLEDDEEEEEEEDNDDDDDDDDGNEEEEDDDEGDDGEDSVEEENDDDDDDDDDEGKDDSDDTEATGEDEEEEDDGESDSNASVDEDDDEDENDDRNSGEDEEEEEDDDEDD